MGVVRDSVKGGTTESQLTVRKVWREGAGFMTKRSTTTECLKREGIGVTEFCECCGGKEKQIRMDIYVFNRKENPHLWS